MLPTPPPPGCDVVEAAAASPNPNPAPSGSPGRVDRRRVRSDGGGQRRRELAELANGTLSQGPLSHTQFLILSRTDETLVTRNARPRDYRAKLACCARARDDDEWDWSHHAFEVGAARFPRPGSSSSVVSRSMAGGRQWMDMGNPSCQVPRRFLGWIPDLRCVHSRLEK